MIQIHLTQCSFSKPEGKCHGRFNQSTITRETLEEVLEALEGEYGIIPPKRPKGVFVDGPDGKAVQVGFIVNRWVEYPDNSRKKYWEENWVTFSKTTTKRIALPKFLQAKH